MNVTWFPVDAPAQRIEPAVDLGHILRTTIGSSWEMLPRRASGPHDVHVYASPGCQEHPEAPSNHAATDHLGAPRLLRGPILVVENLPDDNECP